LPDVEVRNTPKLKKNQRENPLLLELIEKQKKGNAQEAQVLPLPVPVPLPLPIILSPNKTKTDDEAGPLGINWFQIGKNLDAWQRTLLMKAALHIAIALAADEKTADELLPGSLKRSPSYNPKYGTMTRDELEKAAKAGDQAAKKMKKLVDQIDRLLDKNKNK